MNQLRFEMKLWTFKFQILNAKFNISKSKLSDEITKCNKLRIPEKKKGKRNVCKNDYKLSAHAKYPKDIYQSQRVQERSENLNRRAKFSICCLDVYQQTRNSKHLRCNLRKVVKGKIDFLSVFLVLHYIRLHYSDRELLLVKSPTGAKVKSFSFQNL